MMTIDISDEERESLAELLENTRRDLRQELHRTESFDFKEMLQQKETLLTNLINKLEQPILSPEI